MRRVEFDPFGGCWLWSAGQTSDGYGSCQAHRKTLLAHRVSWELFTGSPPDGLVCHRCDVRACVNPEHLFVGTQVDNMADMARKGRADRKVGQRNGRAVLTDEQAWEIRFLLKTGLFNQRQIARSYGVADSSIARVAKSETFRHVHLAWPTRPPPLPH